MIRLCMPDELEVICAVINDAAQAYKGVIPADRWHEPYMPMDELAREVEDGVTFWGIETDGRVEAVMGIQDRSEVDLIRHAYVCSRCRRQGLGGRLLHHLEQLSAKPILIGTWIAAVWAIRFYEKHGYRVLGRTETEALLRRYWTVPERQIATSVVLASPAWKSTSR